MAHISQTSPRTSFATRPLDSREKSSEWPQFTGASRNTDGLTSRSDRRTVTNPNLTLSAPGHDLAGGKLGTVSASATPLVQQHPQIGHQAPLSRRSSPQSLLESLNATTRSVPATPLGMPNTATHLLKTPGTPHTPDSQVLNGRLTAQGSHQLSDSAVNASALQASLSRLPSGQYENGLTFSSIQSSLDDPLQVCLFSSNFLLIPDLWFVSSNSTVWIQFTISTTDSTATVTTRTASTPMGVHPPLPMVRVARRLCITTMGPVTAWDCRRAQRLALRIAR